MTVLVLPNVPETILQEWNAYAVRSGISLEQLVLLMTNLGVRSDRLNLNGMDRPTTQSSPESNLLVQPAQIPVAPVAKSTKPKISQDEKPAASGNLEAPLPDAARDAVAAGTTVHVPVDWLEGPSAGDLEDAIPANL